MYQGALANFLNVLDLKKKELPFLVMFRISLLQGSKKNVAIK
jgi:hypothetical protein